MFLLYTVTRDSHFSLLQYVSELEFKIFIFILSGFFGRYEEMFFTVNFQRHDFSIIIVCLKQDPIFYEQSMIM